VEGRRVLRLSVSLARTRPFVRAATELTCFGVAWCVAGTLLLAGTAVLGATGAYETPHVVAIVVVLGLSLGCVLGGLLLAKRTGPAILYARLLDRAPEVDDRVPLETPAETARRTIAPALLVALTLTAIAPFAVAVVLLMIGEPRDEVVRDLPATAPAAGGGWTLACGLAGLRMASYFEHWEERRRRTALCRPLTAGLMQRVYFVTDRRGVG
jgi:hypothetical protein